MYTVQGVSSQTAVFISFVAPRWAWIFHQSQSGFDLETWDNHLREWKAIHNFSSYIFLNFLKLLSLKRPIFWKFKFCNSWFIETLLIFLNFNDELWMSNLYENDKVPVLKLKVAQNQFFQATFLIYYKNLFQFSIKLEQITAISTI